MTDPMKIDRLTRRPQFLAAAKGVSQARGAVVVQQLDRQDGQTAIQDQVAVGQRKQLLDVLVHH